MGTLQASLVRQFYQWELLGRGWLLAPHPVELEPPFTPFFGFIHPTVTVVDDGVRETPYTAFLSLFSKRKPKQKLYSVPETSVSYDLFPYEDSEELVELAIALRSDAALSKHAEAFLKMCSFCTQPISFEIEGTQSSTRIRMVCRETDVTFLKGQIATFFPEVRVIEEACIVESFFSESPYTTAMDFGLSEEYMRTLATLKDSSIDPFTSIFSLCDQLKAGERIMVQVLFNGLVNYWEDSVLRSVTNLDGRPFFDDAPEMVPLTKEKIADTMLAVTIRVATGATYSHNSIKLLEKGIFAVKAMSKSPWNMLEPLFDESYTQQDRIEDMANRVSRRAGMLLNIGELATFVHIPSSLFPSLYSQERKTKAAPGQVLGKPLKIGINIHEGCTQEVTLSNELRLRHIHLTGATGMGKSTLLQSMIAQDIDLGNGVCVIDPHGDLIDSIMKCIPEHRADDVVVLDPSDSEYPIGFNILKAHTDIEREVLASDMVASFRRFSTSWGDQMNTVLSNAILAFLESPTGGTLADVRRFLIEKPYRERFLSGISDPHISYYWKREYSLLKSNSIGPILTRLDSFLRPRLIRNMVCQKRGIDFEAVLNKRKILLVKLPQGLIGTENSYLIGSFVVSKIHQAALSRQANHNRPDFFCYLDEFQHFITPSMEDLITGARKYHVGLVLSHQGMEQLQKHSTDLARTLETNVGTRITFRTGREDAQKIALEFSTFSSEDIQNLRIGEAIGRIENPQLDFSFNTKPYVKKENSFVSPEHIISHSRQKYAVPKEDIEAILASSLTDTVDHIEEDNAGEETVEAFIMPKKALEALTPEPEPQTLSKEQKEGTIEIIASRREESRHRYIQKFIKTSAEASPYHYKATIEAPTPDRDGMVDVLLEREHEKIACEVSVTTEAPWELHNIEKCLRAGYDKIIVVTSDKSLQVALGAKIAEVFPHVPHGKIILCTPENVMQHLQAKRSQPHQEETVLKGYRVKVEYGAISHGDHQRKEQLVARVITDSRQKKK